MSRDTIFLNKFLDNKISNDLFSKSRYALRSGAASVCLLSMTFLLGASRLGPFTFEIPARIRWHWDPFSAWGASVSGVG